MVGGQPVQDVADVDGGHGIGVLRQVGRIPGPEVAQAPVGADGFPYRDRAGPGVEGIRLAQIADTAVDRDHGFLGGIEAVPPGDPLTVPHDQGGDVLQQVVHGLTVAGLSMRQQDAHLRGVAVAERDDVGVAGLGAGRGGA